MNERDLDDGTGGNFLAGGVGALLACCAVHFLVIAGVIAGMSGLAFGGPALAIGTAIAALADRSGDERVAVMYAGDEPEANQTVATLIGTHNFVPVDIGALAGAAIMEPGLARPGFPSSSTKPAATSTNTAASRNNGPATRPDQGPTTRRPALARLLELELAAAVLPRPRCP